MFKFADIGLEVDIVVLGIALLVVILFIMSIVILSKCSSLKRRMRHLGPMQMENLWEECIWQKI